MASTTPSQTLILTRDRHEAEAMRRLFQRRGLSDVLTAQPVAAVPSAGPYNAIVVGFRIDHQQVRAHPDTQREESEAQSLAIGHWRTRLRSGGRLMQSDYPAVDIITAVEAAAAVRAKV